MAQRRRALSLVAGGWARWEVAWGVLLESDSLAASFPPECYAAIDVSGWILDSMSPPCIYVATSTSLIITLFLIFSLFFSSTWCCQNSSLQPLYPTNGINGGTGPTESSQQQPSSSCRPPQLTPNPQPRYHNIFTRVPTDTGTAPYEWVNCFFISSATHTISVRRWWAAITARCLSLRGTGGSCL